jgi:3-hydroxypropanoate dehydrogenase
MSGFDHGTVDCAFFGGTSVKSNFLINLGYGDRTRLRQRAEPFSFDEACGIV